MNKKNEKMSKLCELKKKDFYDFRFTDFHSQTCMIWSILFKSCLSTDRIKLLVGNVSVVQH